MRSRGRMQMHVVSRAPFVRPWAFRAIAARYDVRSMANPARSSCMFPAACRMLHVSCCVLRDLLCSMANSARDRYTSRRLRLEYWQASMSKRRNAAGEEESAEPTFPIPDGFVFDESSNLCINVGTGAPSQRKATRLGCVDDNLRSFVRHVLRPSLWMVLQWVRERCSSQRPLSGAWATTAAHCDWSHLALLRAARSIAT